MVFDRKTLVIPEKTKFDNNIINTKGDVIIGDRCLLNFGIKTDGRIFVGEHVIIEGNLEANKDIRIDIFSSIGGDIICNGNVYLGEKIKVNGKLSLKGDLDVADSVTIENGFEAKGWINIRSPIPMVIYIFIYLAQLLKMGHSEEIDRILEEMEENDGDTIPISEVFLFIPNNSIIGNQKSKIDYNIKIGKDSFILGNYESKGDIYIENDCIINGTIKSTKDILCGENIQILGNLDSNGIVKIGKKTKITGNVNGDKIYLAETASINGMLYANHGISFVNESKHIAEEKLRRFENNVSIIDEVEEMLE